MNYIVIELQTNEDVTSNIVSAYDNRADAEAKFHQILAFAATSSVQSHAAIMIDENGKPERTEHYAH